MSLCRRVGEAGRIKVRDATRSLGKLIKAERTSCEKAVAPVGYDVFDLQLICENTLRLGRFVNQDVS